MRSEMFVSFALIFSLLAINGNQCVPVRQREVEISNEFALNLLQTLSNEENTFFSPLSLTHSLLSLLNAAKDDTKEDLLRVLDIKPDEDLKAINSGMKSLLESLEQKNSKELHLYLLAAILIQQEQEESKEELKSKVNSDSREVNFRQNAKQITKQLNQWIAEKSAQRIPRLFRDNLDPNSQIVLTNAVFFHGKWQVPFSAVESRDFQNFISYQMPGIPTKIPFIQTKSKLRSKSVPEIKSRLVEIPYKEKDLSMVIVLPETAEDLQFLNENMTSAQLLTSLKDLDSVEPQLTRLQIPKFKLESEYDLKDSLQEPFELKELFSEHAQLFNRKTRLSQAIHKAVLEVNEESDLNEDKSEDGDAKEVVVDRPFVFLIRDKSNSLVLFMGRVQTLVNEELLGLGFI